MYNFVCLCVSDVGRNPKETCFKFSLLRQGPMEGHIKEGTPEEQQESTEFPQAYSMKYFDERSIPTENIVQKNGFVDLLYVQGYGLSTLKRLSRII